MQLSPVRGLALPFAVLALAAALIGYGGFAPEAAEIARVLFFVSLLAAAIAMIRGITRTRSFDVQEANREQQ
ncbi:MAG TPA: DUF1328 family protein [Burkholderiaceae bacterium]|nr:DUF1328 family protein [Burkholderiaceae bacterium]